VFKPVFRFLSNFFAWRPEVVCTIEPDIFAGELELMDFTIYQLQIIADSLCQSICCSSSIAQAKH
jgi:hypothetical protein